MAEKLVVGPFNRGLRNDVTPFNIDNDSFPVIINAYQWRSKVKRKRGTSLLNRLSRYFNSSSASYTSTTTISLAAITGAANLVTGFSLETNSSIVPGSVTITVGLNTYTDPSLNGTLSPSGTINYASGAIAISAEAGNNASAIFKYYPSLPVMGLEDLILETNQYPHTLAFDTVYSYEINPSDNSVRDVSFYKNPQADSDRMPGYVAKTVITPARWTGRDYQQFWTLNNDGSLLATNGIEFPFTTTSIGMQFKAITNISFIPSSSPADIVLTIASSGLVEGDFLFINEIPSSVAEGVNFQTGYVRSVAGDLVTVRLPNATTTGAGGLTTQGIAQYLTNTADSTKTCLRWYDGDPTDGSSSTPVLDGTLGWVNFCPPLSQSLFSIAEKPASQYYLVGARMIQSFKNRVMFLGPVIQNSGGAIFYLQDTIIYSQNGTPYYTCSFTGEVVSGETTFHPLLVPGNFSTPTTQHTATASAFFEDSTGFGGYISAGIDQSINTVSTNSDVLIVGFSKLNARLVYSGDDISPFLFYIINSELGSSSTFSAINMDQGVITRGDQGFITSSQSETQRIDLEIPDEAFELRLNDNGSERVCSQRDFKNEWIYFTYPVNNVNYKFPTQTLLYNYRSNSWAIFKETYTTYGTFKKTSGLTWGTVGNTFPTWQSWNTPWNSGSTTVLQPLVIAGNQQGFIVFRDDSTDESESLYIKSVSNSTITSPDHSLNNGDYIIITGAIGTIGSEVNGKIFSVTETTQNTFILNPNISTGLTYLGKGLIKRMYVPFIQTKQFPVAWAFSRKTRIGPQQYLLTTTSKSSITLLIYLSQDPNNAYNEGPIIPSPSSLNNALVYSTVLYTCPESSNLGLTPANTNLQMITNINSTGTDAASPQSQIWHRVNTSLLGDTIQLGFTLSDEQMRELVVSGESFEITGATQANPCVLTCSAAFSAGTLIKITGVEGMTQLNFVEDNNNYYNVLSSTPTELTIEVNSTSFDVYTEGGEATPYGLGSQIAEIELHGFIMEVSPSSMLA